MASNEPLTRINFLYQLAAWHTLALTTQDPDQALARSHARNLDLVAKRTRSKLLPRLKRTLCKTCHRWQVPQRTAECRLSPQDHLVLRCRCGTARTFPLALGRDHQTHFEKPGNLR